MGDMITLSKKELDRATVLQQCIDRHLTQVEAAKRLKLNCRHVKRLVKALRAQGATGLVSKRRGKPPTNRIPDAKRQEIIRLVREKYEDFGPTFALEKLTELHSVQISVETLRKWMVAEGLWKGKTRKSLQVFQIRPRRPRFGELVQIDGSPHAWLEDRGPYCTLIDFVDDATSETLYAHFVLAETTASYLEGIRDHIKRLGLPGAYYSDKHSIFRVNLPEKQHIPTQVKRALDTLGIELINARTPQAKGRVERNHKTLQDRLVKEMRLANICTIDQANDFLPSFLERYNRKFSVTPASPQDAHRTVTHTDEELVLILSTQETRKLSRNLTCQFENCLYQIDLKKPGYTLRGAAITVCKSPDGTVTLLSKGKRLPYTRLEQGQPAPPPLADDKEVNLCVDQAIQRQAKPTNRRPPANHPWRRGPYRPSPKTPPLPPQETAEKLVSTHHA